MKKVLKQNGLPTASARGADAGGGVTVPLHELASLQSREAVAARVRAWAMAALGATGADLLTDAAWVPMIGEEPDEALRATGPWLAELLAPDDRPVVFGPGDPRLPELSAPHATGLIQLVAVPSSQPVTALAVYLPAGEPPLSEERLVACRDVAAGAGLAIARLDAVAERDRLRVDAENRVRNVQAMVRSMARRSADSAPSLDDFMLHFEGRLDAIGRSQIAGGWGRRMSLEMLIRDELLAQAVVDGERVSLDGIDVELSAGQAVAIGLAIHELAVNAQKFGALSNEDGRLSVRWWQEDDPDGRRAVIVWREMLTAPETFATTRSGFGHEVIGELIPYELDGIVDYRLTPTGLSCRMTVPLEIGQGLASADVPGAHWG